MNTPPLSSSPAHPALLEREIGRLAFELSAEGLVIRGLPNGPLALTVDETLALADFWRTPGARQLAARAWLNEQHTLALADAADEAEGDETRHKTHAGRKRAA